MRFLLVIFFSTILSLSAFAFSPSSVGEYASPFLKEFTIYPNPTSGAVTLTLETMEAVNGPMELKVYSLIGQEMMKETITPFSGVKKVQLDLSTLPKGLYMVEVSNGDKSRIKRVSVR